MSRSVLTPNGWEVSRPSCTSSMSASGPVGPASCKFLRLVVSKVEGGHSPTVYVSTGGRVIASTEAVVGNTIDRTADPVDCPAGLYFSVTGSPRHIEAVIETD